MSQIVFVGIKQSDTNGQIYISDFDGGNLKQITNNKLANQLLVGEPPRKGWEQYYKI